MDIVSQNQENGGDQVANPRKRTAPSPDEDDEEDLVDKLLPAATAMKRRRVEEGESRKTGSPEEPSFATSQRKDETKKTRKPKKEINIKEVVRERREAEEEAARQDEETLRQTLDGMNVEEMKNLAVIEEMEIRGRPGRAQRRAPNGETNSRWDERWNGRKNFKKFRRQGEGPTARRGQSVIVPLEEVKKKDFGIGDDYWLESGETKKKRRGKERNSQSQSQSQPFTTARIQANEVPSELAIDGVLPAAIDLETPRLTRRQEQIQQTDDSGNTSHAVNAKRPAVSQANGPLGKKRKNFAVQDSESDSDDELKFRFKRRGR